MTNVDDASLVCTPSGANVGHEISGILGIPVIPCISQADIDQEVDLIISSNVRSKHIFVVACCKHPVNSSLMEISLLISALRRSSVERITTILPYFPYARQSYKDQSRVPISSADVALMLEEMGTDAVITVDLYCAQIMGFFSPFCAVDNVSCIPTGARHLWRTRTSKRKLVVVAPHESGVTLAKVFFDALLQFDHQ